MTQCSGAPANQHVLAYIEGSLPDFEAERFEDHYFACPVCLEQVEALVAVRHQLGKQAVVLPIANPARARWTTGAWAWAAAAAVLAAAFVLMRMAPAPQAPAVAHVTPKPAMPAASESAPAKAAVAQLADLALPAFIAHPLRGDGYSPNFDAAMRAYAKGDCGGAVAGLSKVEANQEVAQAARFYTGVCQMHLGEYTAAAANLKSVADAGDSPQQESALYSLAQIALAGNDLSTAHRYLLHTITLRGDLEQRARAKDAKVLALIEQDRNMDNKEQ